MIQFPFPIVDPHIHQWDPYNTPHKAALLVKLFGRYPPIVDRIARMSQPKATLETLGLTDHALFPYLPKQYQQDCLPYHIDTVVHVEANWHHQKGLGVVEETKWLMQLPFGQGAAPKLGAIVAKANPLDRHFENVLQAHLKASPLVRGIRCMAAHHSDRGVFSWSKHPNLYTDPMFLKRFELLARYGLSFDAWAYSTQLPTVTALAKRFSEIPIMIDHLATPVGVFGPVGHHTGRTVQQRAGIFNQWKADIADLAECSNVHAKVSGLLMPILGHSCHKRHELMSVNHIVNVLSPYIEHAIDVFGHERLIFASNFPMDKATASLASIIEAYAQMIVPLGDTAFKAVFRDNALKFYGID